MKFQPKEGANENGGNREGAATLLLPNGRDSSEIHRPVLALCVHAHTRACAHTHTTHMTLAAPALTYRAVSLSRAPPGTRVAYWQRSLVVTPATRKSAVKFANCVA
jgi:hypothetical protein